MCQDQHALTNGMYLPLCLCFYLRGASICHHPHMFKHPPCTLAALCICVLEVSVYDMGMWGPICWTLPGMGCLPRCPTPPTNYMLPCMAVCSRGYLHVLWGNYPYVRGLQEMSAYLPGFWGLSVHPLDAHYASILYLSLSSLCLKSLLPWLQLLLLQGQWYHLVCHLYHQ